MSISFSDQRRAITFAIKDYKREKASLASRYNSNDPTLVEAYKDIEEVIAHLEAAVETLRQTEALTMAFKHLSNQE